MCEIVQHDWSDKTLRRYQRGYAHVHNCIIADIWTMTVILSHAAQQDDREGVHKLFHCNTSTVPIT
jgi:hypothetical protein